MDFAIAMAVFMAAMFVCLLQDYSMLIALAVGLGCFFVTGLLRGFAARDLCKMAAKGGRRAFIVLRIFALIGLITGLWRASGTIACCIYWGIQAITPHWFLLVAFLLTTLMSYALGTSLGVAGTAGVIFMALARSGGVNEALAAGVLLSAVYVGDRGAPSSSCAHLVAAVTGTDIEGNVPMMFKTALIPYALVLIVYALLSWQNPIGGVDAAVLDTLTGTFTVSLWALLPAVLMLVLPFCHVPVLYAMTASILSAACVAFFVQGMDVMGVLRAALWGFKSADPVVGRIFNGGGLFSMLKVSCIIVLSSTYFGIFEETHMLRDVERLAARMAGRLGRFPAMLLSGVALCALFCNQSIAVLMSEAVWGNIYAGQGASKRELAMDIENGPVVVAALVPWCIASSAPLALMGAGMEALPYAAFMYVLPLYWLVGKRRFFNTASSKDIPA